MNKIIYIFYLVFLTTLAHSQTIMTVNGKNISKEDFIESYTTHGKIGDADYSKASIDNAVELYKNYQLKLCEAEEKKIDQQPEVQSEIKKYEDQLVRSEFDKNLMQDLVDEAKQRLNEEICMQHILIDLPGRYRGTKDTIFSYNKAEKVRNEFLSGVSFEKLAAKNSADIDTKYTAGNLGCFTTLQLSSYALENKAYKMKKGQISEPYRTDLGYHILYVTDRRPNNGLVSASQIFIRDNNTISEEEQKHATEVINKAYAMIQTGQDFETVGNWVYTNNKNISSLDEIPEFMVGTYDSDFENAIFELKEVGDVSRPTKTSLGWHIFQLNSREPLPSMEEIEPQLREQIQKDERYVLAKQKFGESLKQKYDFEENQDAIDGFERSVAGGISVPNWQLPSGYKYETVLFTIDKRKYQANGFVNYVLSQHANDKYDSFENYFKTYVNDQLLQYHKEKLVDDDPEMKRLMTEYRNGIVIFNLLEQEVWSKQEVSDKELRKYYSDHPDNYKKENEYDVRIYETSSSKLANKIEDLVKKRRGESSIKALNTGLKARLSGMNSPIEIYSKTLNESEVEDLYDPVLEEKGGVYKTRDTDKKYKVIVTQDIREGKLLPYSEVKSNVKQDYHRNFEDIWTKNLEKKYKVTINERVVESLYKSK